MRARGIDVSDVSDVDTLAGAKFIYLRDLDGNAWAVQDRRRVHDRRSAGVEERRDQREHFAGPLCHADVRGRGEHCELRVRQEFEHLQHVGQG